MVRLPLCLEVLLYAGGITTGTPDPATGAGYIDNNTYEDWFVEESRIKGGFNNTSVDFGNKAYIVEEESKQIRRKNSFNTFRCLQC